MIKIIKYILLCFVLSSCASDYFRVNLYNPGYDIVYVETFAGPYSTDKFADDSFTLLPNALSSLRIPGITQYESDFLLEKVEGDSLDIIQRVSARDMDDGDGLIIRMKKEKILLLENNIIIAENNNHIFNDNSEYIVRLVQEGNNSKFIMDCDTVFNIQTSINAVDYITFKTYETKVNIYTPEITELRKSDYFNLFE